MQEETRIMAIEESVVAGLRADLRGELVEPGDDGYDEARKVYNASIDKRPRSSPELRTWPT
jgi:hypothetical protein